MATKKNTTSRKGPARDAERTKANILAVAREEFASRGLHGARVEAIAAKTRTSKRMIYYYFSGGKARHSSKEELYAAVLRQAYAEIQAEEQCLQDMESLDPREALRRIVHFSFDYYQDHPDFIKLVITENIHQGKHLRKLRKKDQFAPAIITRLANMLDRGIQMGVFKRSMDPTDLHLMISSFSFFRVSNRYTFGDIFKQDLAAESNRTRHETILCDAILAYLEARPVI